MFSATSEEEREEVIEALTLHLHEAGEEIIDAEFGDGSPPSTPEPLEWELHKKLLLREDQGDDCPNTITRPGLWARDDSAALKMLVDPTAPFLNRLAQLCVAAEVRDCQKDDCTRRRMQMESVAPRCEWEAFRLWSITAMACQAGFTHEKKLTRAHTHLVTTVAYCQCILEDYGHTSSGPINDVLLGLHGTERHVELAGVCEVIYWMLSIQAYNGLSNVMSGKWGPGFLSPEIVNAVVNKAEDDAKRLGICPNRMWNLLMVAERKEIDLPPLMEVVQAHPIMEHGGHENCTKAHCPFNKLDTTKVRQLHNCSLENRPNCYRVRYPVEVLEYSIKNSMGSAWACDENRTPASELQRDGLGTCWHIYSGISSALFWVISRSKKIWQIARRPCPADDVTTVRNPHTVADTSRYVAISHVWLDGTGVGIGSRAGVGVVNHCLIDYFLRIVERLGCDGIWWDTISLPITRELRTKCINTMQENYRRATYTVVHDRQLVHFDWAEDGSPCVALVLSSWFTRGWTALELHESKCVKVLYKGPDPDTPLIKDLDDDILAHDPRTATRAHWIASTIIRRLRHPIESVRDLLSILQPRSTTKLADRTKIASLLANFQQIDCPECEERPAIDEDGRADQRDRERIQRHVDKHTTQGILSQVPKIGHVSLMHGKPPLAPRGPFSWAPSVIYDMPVESGSILEEGSTAEHLLAIEEGTIEGCWYFRFLTPEDANGNLKPVDETNEGALRHIDRKWRSYILLRQSSEDRGPALLAATVVMHHKTDGRRVVDCRYVGAVNVTSDGYYGDGYDNRYKYGSIRFGVDFGTEEETPNAYARDVIPRDEMDSNDETSSSGESHPEPAESDSEGWISGDSHGPPVPIPNYMI